MPKILVTNDDGIHSAGIIALAQALESLGDVVVVAPAHEMSAASHSLTLTRPLRIEKIDDHHFSVDGTPTDCVNIAITHILKGKPDLIVSGINKGYNLGDDVTYSGTVSGALEGALLGIPSLAVSLERNRDVPHFDHAAAAAATVASAVLRRGLPPRTLLNINVPRGRPKGLKVTVQARRNHVTSVSEAVDPRGQPYYWIEEGQSDWEPHDRSDYQAVRDGYVSVTPLQPDLTHYAALKFVESLPLGAEVEVE